MALTAREAALKTLGAFRKNGAWSDVFLNNIIKKEGLTARDAALASRICYGVLQNKILCDYYISAFSSIKLNKMEPVVLDILELSVYQLLFLDKIPASAAVDEAVTMAKRYANPRAAGFVNAVLRKISSKQDALPAITGKTFNERLSIQYSHPLALVKRLSEFLDEGSLEKLLSANNEIVPVTAQVNTLKASSEAVLTELSAEGADVRMHPWLSDCLQIHASGSLESSAVFSTGLITIQDAAARLSVMTAEPREGQRVLDACSAPGGKAFMAAILMGNNGEILAADINGKKLQRIERGAERLGIDIIKTLQMDATVRNDDLVERFDLVIADVPCSGLGIIRKKPEIRYKSMEEIGALPAIQLNILENLSYYVKRGGILLYSTCTIIPEENEGTVSAFLSGHTDFSPEAFELPGPVGRQERGMLTLYPHIHGTDGFFMCKMRRAF
jgi:16S rRNA (cytosine967-C5)-methyltransferase